MSIIRISSPDLPAPTGPYSPAIAIEGLLLTSGTLGRDAATGEFPADFAEEVRLAFHHLDTVLTAGGSSRDGVVRMLCLLADADDLAAFNREYAAYFGDARPARTTFAVTLAGAARVELEATAVTA